MNINQINSGVLAYLGDSVYEVKIRYYLLSKFNVKAHELKEKSIKYVSAKNQAVILDSLIENNYLNTNELEIVKRARNYKVNSKPKYTDIVTYKKASGLEALFGYLYLTKNEKRIDELIRRIMGD